jgi:hypothetical protein
MVMIQPVKTDLYAAKSSAGVGCGRQWYIVQTGAAFLSGELKSVSILHLKIVAR